MLKTPFGISLFFAVGLLLSPARVHSQWQRCKTNIAPPIKDLSPYPTLKSSTTIVVPVVFHVLWRTPEENISEAQIQSQLAVLNADFNASNVEFDQLPSLFRSVATAVNIEFCLAPIAPNGQPTNGITRTPTNIAGIASNRSLIKYSNRGGIDAWDSQHYLNIWVGERSDGILGESSVPGREIAEEQGIIIDYRAVGTIERATGNFPYDLGRTLTHEIGHYFGLGHLWGEKSGNEDCSNDDGITDTPLQAGTYFNRCPNQSQFSCGSEDMYMNFMNFTNDACMAMFTVEQRAKMRTVIQNFYPNLDQPNCKALSNSSTPHAASDLQLFPNPAQQEISMVWEGHTPLRDVELQIYNSYGQQVQQLYFEQFVAPTISIENLSPGLYHLQLRSGKAYLEKRFLKI